MYYDMEEMLLLNKTRTDEANLQYSKRLNELSPIYRANTKRTLRRYFPKVKINVDTNELINLKMSLKRKKNLFDELV